VLVLVEPTSSVDAHTEILVAQRLQAARHGTDRGPDQARTTVVTSASPLLLAQCDEVAFLVAGRVVATGSHHDLLARHPGYRDTVTRGEEA
jgi:ABC-type multidrug transport system fused ATPase/permease subunit